MSTSQTLITHDTDHDGMIHDSQFDYYGTRMATCDSNGVVKIWRMEGDQVNQQIAGEFQAHTGPCWTATFAHPKYESVIATCGYDKQIKIWKEVKINQWAEVQVFEAAACVNTLQWAPWEYGLALAAGSADGMIHYIQRKENDEWKRTSFAGHDGSINGLSWGPATEPCLLLAENFDYHSQSNDKQSQLVSKRFVTGAMDGKVKIWQENASTQQFEIVAEVGNPAHAEWVRDVAWSNNIGTFSDVIATCGEDQKLKIWRSEQNPKNNKSTWVLVHEEDFSTPVWKCSWSPVGFMLAASCGDNQTKVYRESAQSQKWEIISEVAEDGQLQEPADAAAQN